MPKRAQVTPASDEGPVELDKGRIVGRRWKIIEKLGEGGCGSVYKVQDIQTMAKAALKAESNFVPGGSVLKLEVQVLRRLEGRRYIAQLLQAGKKSTCRYSYMVMTLFGHSLNCLLKKCGQCSISTQVRVGINILYGIKQLHEVGFIHRDVKPANLAVGRRGKEARIIHILDFGLSREYIISSGGTVKLRVPRTNVLFRGTVRYCSANTHTRNEQGRPDDLWSMVYVLVEMRGPLPWNRIRKKHKVGKIKTTTSDEELFRFSPKELVDIAAHLRTLDYFKRPDYLFIYNKFASVMSKYHYRYSDPFDWEEPKPLNSIKKENAPSFSASESKSAEVRPDSMQYNETDDELQVNETQRSEDSGDSDEQLFVAADFEKNELGF
ncbi:Putative serine/threonine-protein kinase K06H7.1 [Toxocara canis]|uniref:Putative serine/threonine-protein kinase K06H7.1 n=1 Tax=Toxocara canis TaxID=6265 RepID=A0A0B2VRI5_TOXCA|nr:Putative serine/threonine-protein kinase K06H7.1 [Toxocara canis]